MAFNVYGVQIVGIAQAQGMYAVAVGNGQVVIAAAIADVIALMQYAGVWYELANLRLRSF